MKFFVYSTRYSKEIGDLRSIIEDYEKTLEYIFKKSIVSLYNKSFDVGPLELDSVKLACSKKYFSRISQEYRNRQDNIFRAHIYDELIGCNGTKRATELAFMSKGIAYHLGGGYHHAAKFREGGFDYLNDIVYAVEFMRKKYNLRRVLIIDLDVHFPDGTYDTYVRDPNIYQFSIHGWNIFPGRGWITDIGAGEARFTKLNIPLPSGTTGDLYLEALEEFLPLFFRIANPELVIYQAGCDVLHNDRLGNLKLTLDDVYRRDRYIYDTVYKNNKIPLVILAGGGYSENTYKARINTISLIAQERIMFEEKIQLTSNVEDKFRKWISQFKNFFYTHYLK